MTTGSYYKQTSRAQRIIRTEADYSKGMMYVNTPLDTGYSRIILNLDLAENGTGLKPRPGLKTFATTGTVAAFDNYGIDVFCKANSVMRRESDNDDVKYIDTVIVGEDVYKVGPYTEDDTVRTINRLTNTELSFNKDKAHCFAWQGQLYHMHEDGLYHFNDTYAHAQIEPRRLSPKEAVTAGYNMLADEPYTFNNIESVATSGDILGILPYEAVHTAKEGVYEFGELALTERPGEPVFLKIILAVVNSEDVLYQCSLEWRESTQGAWQPLELNIPELKYDETSTKGAKGSSLITQSVYAFLNIPATSEGLPIYVRAQLRVASENEKLYSIGGTSSIAAGSTLGAGTDIPDLAQYNLKFIAEAAINTVTPVNCLISSTATIPANTYINALDTSVLKTSSSIGMSAPTAYYYKATDTTEGFWADSSYYFRDSDGIFYYEPSHILEHLYKDLDDEEPVDNIADAKFFKLGFNEILGWSSKNLIGQERYSCTITGPANIPVEYSESDIWYSVAINLRIASDTKQGYRWRAISTTASADYSNDTGKDVAYTIGGSTALNKYDQLNNTQVYITNTLTAPIIVNAGDEAITDTAASDIAPVTSVVSFVFRNNNKTGAVLKYDLATAKGMCFWQNRLVLWGVNTPEGADKAYQDDSANLLFFSEVNDPSYFPYPQCVSAFTEPVLHALPFGDNLLVITATSMHLVALNEDGLSWTSVQIQSNLRFREDEMRLVQVVNNMVLFKSGPQFYLLVPSTVNIGNLVVAPITQNIKSIFDNPENFIKRLFVALSSQDEGLLEAELAATNWFLNTFVDFEHIHITYTARIPYTDPGQATVDFMYNTSTRVWKVYLYTTTPGHILLRKDAVKSGVYISLLNNNSTALALQYRRFDSTDITDSIEGEGIRDFYSNLHFLDTGLRNQDNAYNKRYREAQLKLSNHTTNSLTFYTEYSLDGVVYLPLYAPSLIENTTTDVVDIDYTLREPLIVPGVAVLEGTVNTTTITEDGIPILVGYNHTGADDVYAFYLEAGHESRFEAPFTIKLRSTILGKGYAPSLKVYSKNTTDFTILDHTWVYRLMNAR